jgi:hypothetical protein
MSELPVEDRPHARGIDDEIAETEIAMNQRWRRLGGSMIGDPAEGELEHRPGLAVGGIGLAQIGGLVGSAHHAQRRQRRERDGVEPRQDAAELEGEARSQLRIWSITQNLARDGFAFDARHDEAAAEIVLGRQHMQHLRRRHPGGRGAAHQGSLGFDRQAAGLGRHQRRRAPQDQGVMRCTRCGKGPGFLAGAAGEAADVRCMEFIAEQALHQSRQRLREFDLMRDFVVRAFHPRRMEPHAASGVDAGLDRGGMPVLLSSPGQSGSKPGDDNAEQDYSRSALMRTAHHLHGGFDVAPFLGLFDVALLFAAHRLLRGLGDRIAAVPFQHLACDVMDLHLPHGNSLLWSSAGRSRAGTADMGAPNTIGFWCWQADLATGETG